MNKSTKLLLLKNTYEKLSYLILENIAILLKTNRAAKEKIDELFAESGIEALEMEINEKIEDIEKNRPLSENEEIEFYQKIIKAMEKFKSEFGKLLEN